jgi:hypothetical protein
METLIAVPARPQASLRGTRLIKSSQLLPFRFHLVDARLDVSSLNVPNMGSVNRLRDCRIAILQDLATDRTRGKKTHPDACMILEQLSRLFAG